VNLLKSLFLFFGHSQFYAGVFLVFVFVAPGGGRGSSHELLGGTIVIAKEIFFKCFSGLVTWYKGSINVN